MKQKQFVIYGLAKYLETIDMIIYDIQNLTTMDTCFDIKLMITEALTNAFKHGNENDEKKPIFIRYSCDLNNIEIQIEDCGCGLQDIDITENIPKDDLLNNSGRGLFLIKCLADRVEIKHSTIIIEKSLIAI